MSFAFIVVTRNRPDLLQQCVDSILALESDFELVVVDNGSDQPVSSSLDLSVLRDPRMELIRSEENLGASGGRNRGVKATEADILIFLDDDAHLESEGILGYSESVFSANPSVGAIQFSILTPEGKDLFPHHGIPLDAEGFALTQMNHVGTGGLGVRQSVHSAVGGFPEDYFVGVEDNWYGAAILAHGFLLARTDEIVVRHPDPDHQATRKLPFTIGS